MDDPMCAAVLRRNDRAIFADRPALASVGGGGNALEILD